ncbi:metal-dependent hydrolase [Blastopirellula sp. JC732]|uniref:UPF0173 metal-dependent hydrolase LOC68_23905 n=1 Tax=Blastopirellula sediminis TaxID=2894196 RepID=A0A9X1SJ29_9BACT|nr:metal-dependent hydrolase [Blastopirellula sediminis]MCC9605249.1 metal-dependent hydrolase [Blastopirellula sediminis]MCC9631451.1 metal-dependent hydrolase [Blastopirellula sediminis]
MATQLTWHGHGTWLIDTGSRKILLDPFFDENPAAVVKSADVDADLILLSHGHFDHVGLRSDGKFDVVEIAARTGAQVVAIYEMAVWLGGQGVENVVGMNVGGTFQSAAGLVRMTPAIHSSSLPDGSYGGSPVGFVLEVPEGLIYFACDTDLFSDMKRIGDKGILLAIIPIGDLYTMGIDDAVEAVKLIAPQQVAPAHYNTWPPIAQDAAAWAEKVKSETSATPHVIKPGETITLV